MREISWVADDLSASQEGLCSMESVSQFCWFSALSDLSATRSFLPYYLFTLVGFSRWNQIRFVPQRSLLHYPRQYWSHHIEPATSGSVLCVDLVFTRARSTFFRRIICPYLCSWFLVMIWWNVYRIEVMVSEYRRAGRTVWAPVYRYVMEKEANRHTELILLVFLCWGSVLEMKGCGKCWVKAKQAALCDAIM